MHVNSIFNLSISWYRQQLKYIFKKDSKNVSITCSTFMQNFVFADYIVFIDIFL